MQTPLSKLKTFFKLRVTIKKYLYNIRIQARSIYYIQVKRYMKLNRDLRREAEKEGNKIKKQNSKSINNAIFGKLIENLMNNVDVNIVAIRKLYLKSSVRRAIKREIQYRNGAIAI